MRRVSAVPTGLEAVIWLAHPTLKRGANNRCAYGACAAQYSIEMKKKSTTARYSLSEIQALRDRGQDKTRRNAPRAESLGADFWKSARIVMPSGKTSVHLRLDRDVVEWFRARGKGHLTRMNAVLRAYVDAEKRGV